MSFLKNIKETLKTVQDDFSDGFKTIGNPTDKPKDGTNPVKDSRSKINWDAGAKLMNKNELIWKELHQYTESTGVIAQEVDNTIGSLGQYCNRQSEILMKLQHEASSLPALLQQLQEITDSLALVEDVCERTESLLVQLENVCEQQEYERNVQSHHKQLAVYKMKKEHELHTYRAQLARQHAEKVEQRDKRREHLLKEKQQAYEDQFSQEVDYFKKHGKPERSPSTPESQKRLDVSDIEIEEDQSALDAFLETEETKTDNSANSTQNPASNQPDSTQSQGDSTHNTQDSASKLPDSVQGTGDSAQESENMADPSSPEPKSGDEIKTDTDDQTNARTTGVEAENKEKRGSTDTVSEQEETSSLQEDSKKD